MVWPQAGCPGDSSPPARPPRPAGASTPRVAGVCRSDSWRRRGRLLVRFVSPGVRTGTPGTLGELMAVRFPHTRGFTWDNCIQNAFLIIFIEYGIGHVLLLSQSVLKFLLQ